MAVYGKKAQVVLMSGADKAAALTWRSIHTNLPEQVLVELAEGQSQDLVTIHELVKANIDALELGLEVTIQL